MIHLLAFFALSVFSSQEPPHLNELFEQSSLYEFTYSFKIPAELAKSSNQKIRVWIPYPHEDESQKVLEYKPEAKVQSKVYRERRYGNKIISFVVTPDQRVEELSFRFKILRRPASEHHSVALYSEPLRFLGANNLVRPFEPRIREIAETEAKTKTTDEAKAKAFYEYVVREMKYDKSGKGWGRGDSVWACQSHRGNCTDFHSLFIAMARSQNIPARFFIGVPIPTDRVEGVISGYHCWAEFYDRAHGWQPLDATEAKMTKLTDKYFGHLPSNRIALSVGRDLVLTPPQHGETLNYFLQPYAEINGKKVKGLKAEFSFKRLSENLVQTKN